MIVLHSSLSYYIFIISCPVQVFQKEVTFIEMLLYAANQMKKVKGVYQTINVMLSKYWIISILRQGVCGGIFRLIPRY